MKRLIVSAIFVSMFFIGVSGLLEGVSANLMKDDKSLELIRAARVAIGGEQNLAEVRSMTIKASTTNFFEKDGVQDVKQGGLEINFQMPGKFSKRVKFGAPGAETTDEIIGEDVDVIVRKGEGSMVSDGKDVFVVKRGDGKNIEWISKDDADVEFSDGKIIVKKDDGTVEEIKVDGKNKARVHMDGGKTVELRDTDENTWVTDDGNKVVVRRDHAFGPRHGSSEMLRTTMALLLTAPNEAGVTYKFLGEGNVDGYPSNIIEVGSNGGSFKLYLDASSNRPQMISYQARNHHVVHFEGKEDGKKILMKRHNKMAGGDMPASRTVEVKFSDYRAVGGLLLPHRWTETVNGKAMQNIDVTGYEINPADIETRFGSGGHGEGKVVIRKKVKKEDS